MHGRIIEKGIQLSHKLLIADASMYSCRKNVDQCIKMNKINMCMGRMQVLDTTT